MGWNRPIEYQIKPAAGASVTVALAFCEGWHDQTGRRVLDLSVEGAPAQKVDTVADLGKNVAGAFWFDAQDVNGDGLIDVKISADDKAQDKNTILNALWVFDAPVKHDNAALLAGNLNAASRGDDERRDRRRIAQRLHPRPSHQQIGRRRRPSSRR